MASLLLITVPVASSLGAWSLLRPNQLSNRYVPSYDFRNLLERFAFWLATLAYHLNLDARRLPKSLYNVSYDLVLVAAERGYRFSCTIMVLFIVFFEVVCALLGAVLSFSIMGLAAGALVGWGSLLLFASRLAKERARAVTRQIPDIYRSLASALSSGKTLAQAISYVGLNGAGVLSREFSRCALMVSCGVSAIDALSELPERLNAPGIELMVSALAISARTGAPLQNLFARSARLVEKRFEMERELETKTAQVRLSAKLVIGLPIGMICLLSLFSPDFREGVTTVVGVGCLAAAACLDICAVLIIRHLMKGVL